MVIHTWIRLCGNGLRDVPGIPVELARAIRKSPPAGHAPRRALGNALSRTGRLWAAAGPTEATYRPGGGPPPTIRAMSSGIMAQNRTTKDGSFAIPRAASQCRTVKLREVAATLIENLDGRPAAAPPEFGTSGC